MLIIRVKKEQGNEVTGRNNLMLLSSDPRISCTN